MQTFVLYFSWFLLVAGSYSYSTKATTKDLIEARKADDNVKFYLYTKNNTKTPQQLLVNNVESVKNSNFNRTHQTKILIHGRRGSYTSTLNGPIREAYLATGDYNLISVDWSDYAKLNYSKSRTLVPQVGQDVAIFVDFLNEKFQMSFDSLVVIGHSLGAHVAGYCGKMVKRGKLSAIVGLDPASPFYNYENPATRLASTDAKYVQTIQTNGNTKGFLRPIGTATFYANWGRVQPGCGSDIEGTCSHVRCISLYAEAIRGYSFAPIYKCQSYDNIFYKTGCTEVVKDVEFGDPTRIQQKAGIYNFETKSEAPYGNL
ncbi:phospholipase A1 VesT1.02-like [Calliphora vicina]|uniref:phospholipase A1 VesT1.02-like n=1 Tax=Calliphora vicina TaxID=7373 RepID=UPI00325B1649